MIQYTSLLCIYIPFYLLAMVLAPVLPIFAVFRKGPIDNNHGIGVEPRLPMWLSWFDTSYDNSLWGDTGWRTKHCKDRWDSYFGMVLWLWRNPAAGFCWDVLAAEVPASEVLTVTHSGNGLNVDKGQGTFGSFLVKSDSGLFQYRVVRRLSWNKVWTFEAGWLLDPYIKSASSYRTAPKALFQFQPQIRTVWSK